MNKPSLLAISRDDRVQTSAAHRYDRGKKAGCAKGFTFKPEYSSWVQ
jgi:hypothetical protein